MPVTREDLKIVDYAAQRFRGRHSTGVDAADLYSDGMLGLHTGVKQWDEQPEVRARFNANRYYYLRKIVQRAIIDGLRARNGRSRDGVHHKQEFRYRTHSLDAYMDAKGDGESNESMLDRFVGVEDERWDVVKDLLGRLPDRERLIVWRTIVEGEPMIEVAHDLGITESRVCQIRQQAMARLRGEPVALPRSTKQEAQVDVLSARERQVLAAMADGLGNREIAEKFFLSEETVKSHVRKMLPKLRAKSRTHAVAIGFRTGLIA